MWVSDDDEDKLYAYTLATGARVSALDFNTSSDDQIYAYNMPANPLLSTLDVEGVNLGTFNKYTYAYTGLSPSAQSQATVTIDTVFPNSITTILPADNDSNTDGHQVALGATDTTITVTVQSGGQTATYTVVVTRSNFATLSNDATLSGLTLSGIDIGTFAASTMSYTVDVANDVEVTTVLAEASETNADVVIAPADSDTGTKGHQASLSEGTNAITVFVTSSDGKGTETYGVTVNRASSAEFGWVALPDFKVLDADNQHSRAIWSDGTTLWVTDLSGALFAYSLSTMERDSAKDITTLNHTANNNANGMWSDGVSIWVSDDRDDGIYVYDLGTGTRRTDLEVFDLDWSQGGSSGVYDPKGLWSDGTTLGLSDHYRDEILAFDLDTGARSSGKDIENLDHAGNLRAAGLWSDGDTMWVTDDQDNKIYAYDLDTGAHRSNLDFDTLIAADNLDPKGLWSNGAMMWVTDPAEDRIFAYNMPANASLSSLELAGINVGRFFVHKTSYAVLRPSTLTETTVSAEVAFPGATIVLSPADTDLNTAGHQASLGTNATTISATVTYGTLTKTYTVTVRPSSLATLSDDATLSGLTLSDADLGTFSANTLVYPVAVGNDVNSTTVVATPSDSNAE